jgi:hypothetical protein
MHNETKVNTNSAEFISAQQKNFLSLEERFIGRIDTPYGVHLIKRGEAMDQARMRATQLTSLLAVIQGDVPEAFSSLRSDLQDSIVWMALQAAQEMEQLVEFVAEEAKGDRA